MFRTIKRIRTRTGMFCFLYGICALLISELTINLYWKHEDDTQTQTNRTIVAEKHLVHATKKMKFYILPLPELTTWLIGNYTEESYDFYENGLNEQQAEVWLHKGFERFTEQESRTNNPQEADIIIICGYLHFNYNVFNHLKKQEKVSAVAPPYANGEWVDLVIGRAIPNKTHVIAIPTWNPKVSNQIGLSQLVKNLLMTEQQKNVKFDVISLGFERNQFWQRLAPHRIIPIPYVVRPHLPKNEMRKKIKATNSRKENFVFFVGDYRIHGIEWGGCNRSMVLPLVNRTDMFVRLVNRHERLTLSEYHNLMATSEYCLILCGDTPTSRSFASSMVSGCIPIRVGSRLRGLCEPPCHKGWGWTIANYSHLPYPNKINWSEFPEVNEADFVSNPENVLDQLLRRIDMNHKKMMQTIIEQNQVGWMYGWGNPINSTEFGNAVSYIWDSIDDYVHQTTT